MGRRGGVKKGLREDKVGFTSQGGSGEPIAAGNLGIGFC